MGVGHERNYCKKFNSRKALPGAVPGYSLSHQLVQLLRTNRYIAWSIRLVGGVLGGNITVRYTYVSENTMSVLSFTPCDRVIELDSCFCPTSSYYFAGPKGHSFSSARYVYRHYIWRPTISSKTYIHTIQHVAIGMCIGITFGLRQFRRKHTRYNMSHRSGSCMRHLRCQKASHEGPRLCGSVGSKTPKES